MGIAGKLQPKGVQKDVDIVVCVPSRLMIRASPATSPAPLPSPLNKPGITGPIVTVADALLFTLFVTVNVAGPAATPAGTTKLSC
jgi:hypothetical protein